MQLIVISREDFFEGEPDILNELFSEGLERLHLRKKLADCTVRMRNLADKIKPEFRSRISLHNNHEIAKESGITGIHFSEILRKETSVDRIDCMRKEGYILSTSLHETSDVKLISPSFSYCFLSPVFDSISKPGYTGFVREDSSICLQDKQTKIFALGGINASNIEMISMMNFDGAAVLGSVWMDTKNAVRNFKKLMMLCR